MPTPGSEIASFSEKDFYLAEFRGRSLAVAVPPAAVAHPASSGSLQEMIEELVANRTRVILLCEERPLLEKLVDGAVLSAEGDHWMGALWRALRAGGRAALHVRRAELPGTSRAAALRLGLAKLVWLDPEGALRRTGGERIAFMDLTELEARIAAGDDRREMLEHFRAMVVAGLPSLNLCEPVRLLEDLLTYEGAGTLFTRERYADVRALALDDLDAANDLLQRGVREGYLVERTTEQVDLALGHGFGVFIEGRYLAGIGAMLPHPRANAGEIASLYTLTRFLGEGVGAHLVRHALSVAHERGYAYVFACTTSERVERFFERHGFSRVVSDAVPEEKWSDYDTERRSRVRCMRIDLG